MKHIGQISYFHNVNVKACCQIDYYAWPRIVEHSSVGLKVNNEMKRIIELIMELMVHMRLL